VRSLGDVLFIKNIDNVLPDRIKEENITYKKLWVASDRTAEKDFCLCGEACEWRGGRTLLTEMIGFMKERLFIMIPDRVERQSRAGAGPFSCFQLNRPMRVCGMVKNEGEPEAGPSGSSTRTERVRSRLWNPHKWTWDRPSRRKSRILDPLQSRGSCLRCSELQRGTF